MKKILILMLIASMGSLFFPGCERADNHLNPNLVSKNNLNPTFSVDIANDTILVDKNGGDFTINVSQNTKYQWIAKSSQDWTVINVAADDTILGSAMLKIKVGAYNSVDPRVATITLKEVLPKSNRQLSIKIIQSGAAPEISANKTSIDADALGGQFNIVLTTNGATWDASTDDSWLSVSPASGKSDTVSIFVTKNTDASTPTRSGSVNFNAGEASVTITVNQNGYTTCNSANNTGTIYFDEFSPCVNSNIGDTWTLTDRRDGKTYLVALMADGRYWMIQDLRFGGNPDIVENKNSLSKDEYSKSGTLGENVAGLFGDMVNHTSHGGSSVPIRTGRGYFYNWRAAMQQADIANVGTTLEKTQGIAPAGWHIPSRGEFENLRDKIGADGVAWGEDANSVWKGIWGGAVDPGMSHWGRAGNYGSYWTSTEMTATQACAWCIEAPNQSGPNNNSKIEDPILPGVAIPWKQTKSSAALVRCVMNY